MENYRQQVRDWLDSDQRIEVTHWWDGKGGGDGPDCPVEGFYLATPASREFLYYVGLYFWDEDIKVSLWRDPSSGEKILEKLAVLHLEGDELVEALAAVGPTRPTVLNVQSTKYSRHVVEDFEELMFKILPTMLATATWIADEIIEEDELF